MIDWREAMACLGRLTYGVIVAAVICLAVSFAAYVQEAKAHSFYPWACCSDLDCAPIDASRVKVVSGGYLVDGKFHVPQAEVRPSPDGEYHACFPTPDNLKCFWAPPPGV